jgi:hypothetical protein
MTSIPPPPLDLLPLPSFPDIMASVHTKTEVGEETASQKLHAQAMRTFAHFQEHFFDPFVGFG